MREEFHKIRFGPVILTCLALLVALGAVFFGLYIVRMMGLNTVDYSVCTGETDYMALSYCVGTLARDHLKDPHWQAVQLFSYIVTAMGVSAVAARLAGAQRLAVCALASLMAALAAAVIFKPAALVAWGALSGGVLGALIVDHWSKRTSGRKKSAE